ncbi:MAG: 50S ribosomal protein L18 [Patescibacteria group bacterium]
MYHVKRRSVKQKRQLRSIKNIFGTAERPRLTVFRSNKYTYAQIIDDEKRVSLVTVFDEAAKLHENKTKSEAAKEVGKLLAKRAKEKNIDKVVFDRKGYKYHGRVKSLAEGAREGGLDF